MSQQTAIQAGQPSWLHSWPEAERYSIELHTDLAAFDFLRDQWAELCERAAFCSPFQLPVWQQKWAEHLLNGRALRLVTVSRGGRLAGIAPMTASERHSFLGTERVIEFLGAGDSDYLDFICASGDPGAIEALLNAVLDLDWDVIDLSGLPERSETRRVFPKVLRKRQFYLQHFPPQVCPAVELSGSPETDRELYSRKDMKRYTNAFRREGKLEYRRITDPAELRARLPQFFHQHRKRWSIDERTSQFNRLEQREFFYDVAEHLQREGVLHFTGLFSNERPAAFHLGFVRDGIFTYYKPCYDLAAEKLSPGIVLLRFLFEEAVQSGWKVFDFATGAESYKYRFANKMSNTHHLQVYRRRSTYLAWSLGKLYEVSRERAKQNLKQNAVFRSLFESYKRRERQRQTARVLAAEPRAEETSDLQLPDAAAAPRAQTAERVTPAVRVETIGSLEALRAVAPEWDRLVEQSAFSTINQTFEWTLNWWTTRARNSELRVLLARDSSGKLLGIAPLCLAQRTLHGRRARVMEFISADDANYLDFIAAPENLGRVVHAFLSHLLQAKKTWDAICFVHIPEESHSPEAMQRSLRQVRVKWRLMPCSSSFLWRFGDREQDASIAKKKNFNTKHNYFRKAGDLQIKRAATHEETDQMLDVLFEQQIERRSLTSRPSKFVDPAQRAFFRAMAHSALGRGWLNLMALVSNGKPVAIEFGFKRGLQFTRFIPSFDIRFAKRSPGELIMKFLFDDLLEWKVQECDHGRGPEPYKAHYSNALRYNSQLFVYASRWLYAAGLLETARLVSTQSAKDFLKRSKWLREAVHKIREWRRNDSATRNSGGPE